MTLISRIKQLAQSRQLTLAQLERNVGISNGQIRRWDTSSPKVENLLKIADYFSVSLDYLMGRTQQTEINHQAPMTSTQKRVTYSHYYGRVNRRRNYSVRGRSKSFLAVP